MSSASELIVALNRLGVTCAMLSREIGVAKSTIHHWRAGSFRPGLENTFDLMDLAERAATKAAKVAMTQPDCGREKMAGRE